MAEQTLDAKWYTLVANHIKVIGDAQLSEEKRAQAARELASLASSDSTNERMNKQNLIVDYGAGEVLVNLMIDGASETERWWASLALVQLTYGNERSIMKLIDLSVLGNASHAVKRWMIGDEALETEILEQKRLCAVRAACKVLANEVAYATDRYGSLSRAQYLMNVCSIFAIPAEA
jgi:hypothetical protein